METGFTLRRGLLTAICLSLLALLLPIAYLNLFGIAGSLTAALDGYILPELLNINGAQLTLGAGLTFSLLGDLYGVLGFGDFVLSAAACLALFIPSVAAILCLCLVVWYSGSKKTRIAVLALEIASFAVNFAVMVVVIRLVNLVNDQAILCLRFGCIVAPVVSLACVILTLVWNHQEQNRVSVTVESAGNMKYGGVICLAGEYAGTVLPLEKGEALSIGRDGAVCNIVLTGDKISRTHCTIRFNADRGSYTVTDQSSNGTFVKGGSRLVKLQDTELEPGTTLSLGSDENMFRLQ